MDPHEGADLPTKLSRAGGGRLDRVPFAVRCHARSVGPSMPRQEAWSPGRLGRTRSGEQGHDLEVREEAAVWSHIVGEKSTVVAESMSTDQEIGQNVLRLP